MVVSLKAKLTAKSGLTGRQNSAPMTWSATANTVFAHSRTVTIHAKALLCAETWAGNLGLEPISPASVKASVVQAACAETPFATGKTPRTCG
jgi:hypothetical protein